MTFDPDSFEGRVLTDLAEIKVQMRALPDHEDRLRSLERWKWGLAGAWALICTWLEIHTLGHK